MILPAIKKIVYILLLVWISFPATHLKIFGSDPDAGIASFAGIIPEDAFAFCEWKGFQKDWNLIRHYPFWEKLIAEPEAAYRPAGDTWLHRYLRTRHGISRKEFFNVMGRHVAVALFPGDSPSGFSLLLLARIKDRSLAENTLHDIFSDHPPVAMDHIAAGGVTLPVYSKTNPDGETILHYSLFKNILIAEMGTSYDRLRYCIHLIGAHGTGSLEQDPSYASIQKELPAGGSNRGYISLEKVKSAIQTALSGCPLKVMHCFKDRILENLSGWHAVGFRREFSRDTIITDIAGTYEQAKMAASLRHLVSVQPSADHLFPLMPASALVAESYQTDPAALYEWVVGNMGPLWASIQEQFPVLGIPSIPAVSDDTLSSIRRSFKHTMGFLLLPPKSTETVGKVPGIPLLIFAIENRDSAESILNKWWGLFPSSGEKETEEPGTPVLHAIYHGIEIRKIRCNPWMPATMYYCFLDSHLVVSPVAGYIETVIDTVQNRTPSIEGIMFTPLFMSSCPGQTHELFLIRGETVRDWVRSVSLILNAARSSPEETGNGLAGSDWKEMWRIATQAAGTIETIKGWTVLREKSWQSRIFLSFPECRNEHGFK